MLTSKTEQCLSIWGYFSIYLQLMAKIRLFHALFFSAPWKISGPSSFKRAALFFSFFPLPPPKIFALRARDPSYQKRLPKWKL